MKKKIIVGSALALVFGLPLQAVASPELVEEPPKVIISEVNWAGSATSSADEWLELQNLEEEAIDLSGWSIDGAATSNTTLTLPEDAIIQAHGVYLISNYAQNQSTLARTPDFTTTAVALGNSGLRLVLRDRASTEVDSVGYGGAPSAGSSLGAGSLAVASMIRDGDGWVTATTSQNFDAGVTQFGTPGVADVVVEAQATETETPTNGVDVTAESTINEGAIETPTDTVESFVETEMDEVAIEPESDAVLIEQELGAEPVDVAATVSPLSYSLGELIINEVVSDPADAEEWVELYNPYDNVIPLGGWQLREAGGTSVKLNGLIGERQFVSIAWQSKLNNAGDTVMLLDPSGAVIDTISFGKIDKGSSLARDEQNNFVLTTMPTKNEANIIVVPAPPTPTATKSSKPKTDETASATAPDCGQADVRLVRLLADPSDDEMNEVIVIENTLQTWACLDGWTLADASKSFALSGTLGPKWRLELPRTVTHIALNNTSAETVTLTNPNGQVVDQTSYAQAIQGVFFFATDAGWKWENVSESVEPTDVQCPEVEAGLTTNTQADDGREPSVKSSTRKTSTKQSQVEGVVIATAGMFGEQIMYIDGLQLYEHQGEFRELSIGDRVIARGATSVARGERRLKLSGAEAITVIGTDTAQAEMIILDAAENYVGRLVTVTGTVMERRADRLTLEADGATLLVIAKEGTELTFRDIPLGTSVNLTGVVSQFDESVRLLPRMSKDIEVLPAEQADKDSVSEEEIAKGVNERAVGLGLAGATTTAVGARAWWYRRKKKQS